MVSAVNLQNRDSEDKILQAHLGDGVIMITGEKPFPPTHTLLRDGHHSLEDLGLHASQESQLSIRLHSFSAFFFF